MTENSIVVTNRYATVNEGACTLHASSKNRLIKTSLCINNKCTYAMVQVGNNKRSSGAIVPHDLNGLLV